MRTLNEQIQRLRNVLVTCYRAIKDKGGTIPEAGERNMTNLPAAVLSIPQVHSKLTELEVTANGVYLPAEHDADGFSKVIARFDTSSMPKVKVADRLIVSNECINDNGRWDGENLIDTSECTIISFTMCHKLVELDANDWNTQKVVNLTQAFGSKVGNADENLVTLHCSNWDTSNVTSFTNIFQNCYSLKNIDVSKWDTSSATSIRSFFNGCAVLESVDCTNWSASKVIDAAEVFYRCYQLKSIVGNRTIDEVREGIKVLSGLKISADMFFGSNNIDTASLRAVINGLADVTDQPSESRPTLTLGNVLITRLETEDPDSITIATEKGWDLE